jgi:CheY-like chemotaxis protein
VSHKLLLADDSATIQRVVELTFSGEDIEVVTVADGDQAIARIPIEKPDIILADIAMPKRSGYEVAAFVRARPDLAHVPVLLLAGAFEPVDEARVQQAQCDGVLVKPFEPQQVVARVRELVERGSAGAVSRRAAPPPPAPRTQPSRAKAHSPQPSTGDPTRATQRTLTPPLEPQLPRPETGVASAEPPDSSLEDYFDRLDAAFATISKAQSPSASEPLPLSPEDVFGTGLAGPESPPDDAFAAASIEELIGRDPLRGGTTLVSPLPRVASPPPEPPDSSPTIAPAQGAGQRTTSPLLTVGNPIADAFSALFAVEQGDADPASVRAGSTPTQGLRLTDDVIEEITRRVVERLAQGPHRSLVADIVSETAERLVREEIARIRGAASS